MVTIKDNKEGSKDSNIDLRAGNVVKVVDDLTNEDQIGLSLNFGENNVLYKREVFTVVACGTENKAAANVTKFKSDNVCYPISTNGTNIDMKVPGYEVTVRAGTGMACSSGAAEQTIIAGTELASITYNVNEDYYFPEGYTVSGLNGTGISVTRNSYKQITISGTPTGDVTINLPAATEKTEQKPQPTGVTFVATGAKTGELRGASREMEYLTWLGHYRQLGEGTRVFDSLSAGDTITVRTKGGDTVKPSEPIVFSVTQKETPAGVTVVACSEAGVNDGRLLGVTSEMEYKKYDEADGTRVEETTALQPDNTKLKTIEKTKPDGTIITTKVVLDASNNMISSKAVVKVSGEVVENTSKLGFEATDNMITEVKTMVSNQDTTITFVVLTEANKVAYKVVADTKDLKAGNQLYVTALDRKTGGHTLVNKKYTVSEANELDISMSVKKKYFLIDKAEMEEMTENILKTVTLEEKNVSMAKGDRIKIVFSNELNRLNVKSIVYDNKSEDMIAVSSNGFVRAKRTGKAKVKVVVKLKNGVTKTLTMTLNIK